MIAPRSFCAVLWLSVACLTPSLLAHSVRRNPVSYITLVEDAVIQTPSHRVNAYSSFDLTFTAHGGRQKIRLALEPNDDVLHEDFAITHLNEDGTVREVIQVPRHEDKVYRGTAFVERQGIQGWSMAGWARIYVHQDGQRPLFDGAFRLDGDNHHILSRTGFEAMRSAEDPVVHHSAASDAMIMWRDSDIRGNDDGSSGRTELKRDIAASSTCSADSLAFNSEFKSSNNATSNLSLRSASFGSLFGRDVDDTRGGATGLNLTESIGSTAGCPMTKSVALVGIATDCNYFSMFNSADEVKKNVISVVNKASEVYERFFKISLAIANLTLIDKNCTGTTPANAPWNVKCGDSVKITDRLNTFSTWRGESSDKNAYWSLFTTCATNTAVGLAWRGLLCKAGADAGKDGSGNSEMVAATNVVVKTDTEWQIFAHETGHTFGAVHDCDPSTCADGTSTKGGCCPLNEGTCNANGKFIMNPSTGAGITDFSPCSIGNICAGLKNKVVSGGCLTDNKNVQTSLGSQCGNGIVEAGEDCDCGGDAGCNGNKCCDAKTCRFTTNSQCDPSNEDCCTTECRFATGGTVCRPSTGECDVDETCPGTKAACPEDKHKNDGDSCGASDAGLQCASGQCTSRDLQCQLMSNSVLGRNNTKACPDTDCVLACTSPSLGANRCMSYNQFFVDGTSCGAGGHCARGKCEGSSTLKEIAQWIEDHKPIFIPIVAVVGTLILLALGSCITSGIRRRLRRRKLIRMQQQQQQQQKQRPGMMSSWPSSSSSAAYVGPDTSAHHQDGHPYQQQPTYPPPTATNGDPPWVSRRSMRYA